MKLQRRQLILGAAGLAATRAFAQGAYPSKTIQWVVPYAAGGGTDIVARTVAQAMGPALGQTIVVENKPGANTAIGAASVAQAAADGHVIGSADNATLALNQHLFPKLAYAPEKDFVFVGGLARFPYALLVHPAVPLQNFREFVEAGKVRPGALSYGTPGLGGPNHVAMELLQQRTGARFNHVPYKGAAPGLQDLVAGQIQFMLVDTASSMPFIKAGKLRALAVPSRQRIAVLPDVPTIAEAGYPDFDLQPWTGFFGPANVDKSIVAALSVAMKEILAQPDVAERLAGLAMVPAFTTPEEFADMIRKSIALWKDIAARTKIVVE